MLSRKLNILLLICVTLLDLRSQTADTINITDATGKKQGYWVHYFKYNHFVCVDTTRKKEEGYYKDDRKTGVWTEYYCNQNPRTILNFSEGFPVGPAKFFYETGNLQEEGIWKKRHFLPDKCYYENGKQRDCRVSNYSSDTTFRFKPVTDTLSKHK
jgi:hypothetical protein